MEHNRENVVENGDNKDREIDWSRFGLNRHQDDRRNGTRENSTYDGFGPDIYPTGANELFAQEYVSIWFISPAIKNLECCFCLRNKKKSLQTTIVNFICFSTECRPVVEIQLFCITACSFWHMGRSIYFVSHKYFWGHSFPQVRLDRWPSWSSQCRYHNSVDRYAKLKTQQWIKHFLQFRCQFLLSVFISVCVALVTVLSAVGICERCRVESGGVYFLLSHVLGSRFGGSIGLLYCFGQVNYKNSN